MEGTLTKAQAQKVLEDGGKVFLDDETYLKAIGPQNKIFVDQTGFIFTHWFHNYAPFSGWRKLEETKKPEN